MNLTDLDKRIAELEAHIKKYDAWIITAPKVMHLRGLREGVVLLNDILLTLESRKFPGVASYWRAKISDVIGTAIGGGDDR